MVRTVLVADSDTETRQALAASLTAAGYVLKTVSTGQELLDAVAERPFDCIVTDCRFPDLEGTEAVRRILTICPRAHVVALAAQPDVASVAGAFAAGADDYLAKSGAVDELPAVLERIFQHATAKPVHGLKQAEEGGRRAGVLIGTSPGMVEVYKRVARVADISATVLITGETGSGKEQIARAIHSNGCRAALPFVAVDCAAIPENLFESEFFGHERGAFTGAHGLRRGVLETAGQGTCFLDEIGELPLHLQAKLLRALQERVVRRVGSSQTIPISARIICATNRDLSEYVSRGAFREDLYYRLNVVPINLPPLRERKGDIQSLVEHFAVRFSGGRAEPPVFSTGAMDVLLRYPWPGNVRQLENMIERTVALTPYPVILPADLPEELLEADQLADRIGLGKGAGEGSPLMLRELNRKHIDSVLAKTGGNKLRAAQMLGIDRRTLYRILQRTRKVENDDLPD